MVVEDESIRSPGNSGNPSKKRQEIVENGQKDESLFSPGFRSVAAMAGWDEEALLIASLIVEDTPDRQSKQKKRSDLHSLKTPPTNSRRKRRAQRRSPASIPVTILDLDEDEPKSKQESESTSKEETAIAEVEKHSRVDEEVNAAKSSGVPSLTTPSIPCLDRLREELSCAICLEICYEPSTTPCGHSFCKKCLSSAADRCGRKCPKCRQIISTGKYCKVNTVLWNTVQLLFPQEVEARKAAVSASESLEPRQSRTRSHHTTRSRAVEDLRSLESSSHSNGAERRRNHEHERIRSRGLRPQSSRGDVARSELPNQDRDAALALRLQREEFMEAFAAPDDRRSSLAPATARANLRAMASRAINIRIGRGRRD